MNRKRIAALAGALSLLAGIPGLVHPRIGYHQKEELARFGPVQATIETEKVFEISPLFSIPLLLAGIALLLTAPRFKS